MLDSLRKAAGTWVAKLLLVLLVLSFAVWGISGSMMSGPGGTTVVQTGDTRVSVMDYRLAYDRQLSVLSQQLGQRITREQAQAFGVDDQVLQQLVAGALLDEQANRLGLGVSRDKLAELTMEDPAFQGANGQFDRQRFDYVLRQIGMRPEDYLKNREQVAIRQQIVEAVSDGIAAPDAFLRAVTLYQGESRTIDYVAVPESAAGEVKAPDDAALQAYFDENKAKYAAPEYRKIAYVRLEPENISDPAAISDEDVAKDYEANKRRYTTAGTRTIDQLVFSDEAAAKAAADKIKAGASFDEVVTEQGKTAADVRLGELTKERISDPAVAEAAFALDEGAVSDVVKGAFGPVLLRVTNIVPDQVKTLDEAREEIRKDLALVEANAQINAVHDSYEDARAAGETIEEAAGKLNLKIETVDAVDRQAQRPDGTIVNDLPASNDLLREAFETEPNVENAAINLGSNGYLFFEVKEIIAARDRTLDEVREKVLADWTGEEQDRLLSAKVAELEKRLRDGATVDEIATEIGATKQSKPGLKRGADDADVGAETVTAVFAVPQNGVGSAISPAADSRILFRVTEIFEPAASGAEVLDERTRNTFASGMSDDLLDQLVARLRGEYQVTTNPAAVQQALSF